MKKLFGLIVVVLLALGGWKAWDYYQSTYVGKDYYAIITAPLPEETDIKDAGGKTIGKGYNYALTGYDAKGKSKALEFDVITTGEYRNGDAYAEGTVFKINASDKRIIKKDVITLDDVPEAAKTNLQ